MRLSGTLSKATARGGGRLLDAIFGMPDQELIVRHESGSSAIPYVDGGLLAIREVGRLVRVHRGLESVIDF